MAQMSFVFFIIGFNTEFADTIAYYQLIVHSISNFMIYVASNKNLDTIIDELSFTKKNLLTITICVFSIIGIPFFPGFIVKWTIGILTLVNQNIYLFASMMLVSIVWIVSFMPILVNSYINNSRKEDANISNRFVLIIGNITIITLGIFSRYLLM
jgi:NADH:ubiquinone oxidoreductase subunit 2 (subunit N)